MFKKINAPRVIYVIYSTLSNSHKLKYESLFFRQKLD